MPTLVPLFQDNPDSVDPTENLESEIIYKKGVLIAWAAALILLIALLSYSDYADIPTIASVLSTIVFVCVGARLLSLCTGIAKKRERQSTAEPNLDTEVPRVTTQASNFVPSRPRLYYLDNIKIFLTTLVVSHHVTCSFGGCGPGTWTIMIGLHSPEDPTEPPVFTKLANSFVVLNQAYFMSLFFFISAYFVPSSYLKKETWEFHYDKAKRYMIPYFLVLLIVMPIAILIAMAVSGSPLTYFPNPGPAWFIFWLVIFNTIYASAATRGHNEGLPIQRIHMPKFLVRGGFGGILICGFCMGMVLFALSKRGDFFSMPLTIGSLVCDIFFFIMGVIAYHNRWLQTPIRDQLDIPVWFLRTLTFVEASILVYLIQLESFDTIFIYVAGMFCIDMSLVVLEAFQSYADRATPLSTYLSKAAYGVYLIHPVVVTFFTSIFVLIYNAIGIDDGIQFQVDTQSYSQLIGPDKGGLVLFMGWFICNILSHAACWPLAYWMKTLPGLKHVL